MNRVDGEMIFCVLLHSMQSRVMLESTVLNFKSQILSHASEDNILFFLVTDDVERDKHFVRLPNINLWMVDEEERQLRIYDDMPDDFYGIRYGIEKTLLAGKTNAWGTVGTTTRAASSRGTTTTTTSSVSIKRLKNNLKSFPFVTVALIAINVIWFIVLLLKGDPSKASYMAEMGASFGPYVFEEHQFWRILTSMFMHFNFQHLLGNMIYLGIAGFNLEKTIGHVKYILIYMLSGIGAGLISCAYYYFTGVNTVCAGASGAIYGLIGAVIVLTFKSRGRLSKSMMWVRIGIVLLFLFYSNFTNSQVDAVAHIAGFLFGIILTLSFNGGRKKKR
ncbi:MAG: rhomboid family intramembrane serine protease [Lachnospiraceae bacterium]|nr:rhomboid family intramembrane serine protease [Lachnospiraceae bacterium]